MELDSLVSALDSLAVSALSTPLATSRTERTSCLGGMDSLTEASTRPNSQRTATSEMKISDLFFPVEQRLQTRLDALEADFMRRCGQLESKVSVLVDTVAGNGFLAQRPATPASENRELRPPTPANQDRELPSMKLQEFQQALNQSCEKQSSLQANIDELWRQLKADQQKSVSKINSISDTVDLLLLQGGSKSRNEGAGVWIDEFKQPIPERGSGTPGGFSSDASPSLHVAEEEERLPRLLGAGPVKAPQGDFCNSEVVGSTNTGVRRRHSAFPGSAASLQASSPQLGRLPLGSPSQKSRALEPSSPQVASSHSQQRSSMGAQAQAGGASTGVGPSTGVRRGTSVPFSASTYVTSQRAPPPPARSQGQGVRPQGVAPRSPSRAMVAQGTAPRSPSREMANSTNFRMQR